MGDELLIKIIGQLEEMDKRLITIDHDIHNRIDTIERDISTIKSCQIKMENDLTTKVTALFDGWQQHEDYSATSSRQLDHIVAKLDKLALTTTRIYNVQEDHSGLLDLLSASTALHEAEIKGLKRAK